MGVISSSDLGSVGGAGDFGRRGAVQVGALDALVDGGLRVPLGEELGCLSLGILELGLSVLGLHRGVQGVPRRTRHVGIYEWT